MNESDKALLPKLVAEIVARHNPDAIILHGSRVRGFARPHSDWDFRLVYEEKPPISTHREWILEQNVELGVTRAPKDDLEAVDRFAPSCAGALVCHDPKGIGARIVAAVNEAAKERCPVPELRQVAGLLFVRGRLDAMREAEFPQCRLIARAELWEAAANRFMELTLDRWSLPPYQSRDEIAKASPSFAANLDALAAEGGAAAEDAAGAALYAELRERVASRFPGALEKTPGA